MSMHFDELAVSKIAFLTGYENVYYNEFKEDGPIALPSKWLIDSSVVYDFANDHGLLRKETEEGDVFFFEDGKEKEEFIARFKTAIERSEKETVDELLATS